MVTGYMVLSEICRGQINSPFYATPWFMDMDILLHSTDNHIGYPLHFCQMWWLLTAVCRFYKIFTSAVDNIFSDADGGCRPPYRTWLNIELLNLPRLNDDNRILSGDCCLVCGMLFTLFWLLEFSNFDIWHLIISKHSIRGGHLLMLSPCRTIFTGRQGQGSLLCKQPVHEEGYSDKHPNFRSWRDHV